MLSPRSARRRRRVFLLSPARLDGERARMLFEPVTMFPVAAAIRTARLCGGLRASTPEAQDRRPRHHDEPRDRLSRYTGYIG